MSPILGMVAACGIAGVFVHIPLHLIARGLFQPSAMQILAISRVWSGVRLHDCFGIDIALAVGGISRQEIFKPCRARASVRSCWPQAGFIAVPCVEPGDAARAEVRRSACRAWR